jgi:hypothetical protein
MISADFSSRLLSDESKCSLAWQTLIALDLKLPAKPESQMHLAPAN